MTSVRWTICWMLFFATVFSYVDRAVLAVLKPLLEHELHWSQIDYGWMVTLFQLAYALGYAFAGRLIDRWAAKFRQLEHPHLSTSPTFIAEYAFLVCSRS